MGWYRRPKFAFDAFHSFASKTAFNNSILGSYLRILQQPISSSAPVFSKSKVSGFAFASQIFRNSGSQLGLRQNQQSPFICGSRRYYYVDKNQVYHFRQRGFRRLPENSTAILIAVLIGSGFVITVYFGHLETVPYTKRNHFVLLSHSLEKKLGEAEFQKVKAAFKGKILPPIHPESVRVRLIAGDIIEALQKGFGKERVWTDLGYASESPISYQTNVKDTLAALTDSPEAKWQKDDEILDDKWVQKSRKKGCEKGKESASRHLEEFKWEVLVVNEPIVNAFCLPGGKIVVFTGLLKHFRTDAEIATIIGHEVAHAVARHAAEGITKNLWLTILQLILYQFIFPDIANTMSALFLRLPFSRRMEMEADYIGLLLMASAGYDPRIAPRVYEKLAEVEGGDSALRDYLSTHPSGKKRAKLLSHAKVMEEALLIYREVQAGKGIEGFL